MTGYQSKKKAASAKTIDQVNWADHEPDGLTAAAFIAAEESKVRTRYGYVPKLHPSEYMQEQPAQDKYAPSDPFEKWWYYEGSGPPQNGEDFEEHTKRMCKIAWSNGAYVAAHTAQDKLELVDYEKLAALGWQAIECPFCGSSGAQAFPKPAQEPVAHIPADALEQIRPPQLILNNVPLYNYAGERTVAVYTTPPQRPWVGLTDEEGHRIVNSCQTGTSREIFRAIEQALKEKNT